MSRQDSFRGGEISPNFRSRTDIKLYETAAALIRNWWLTPDGLLMTRPGTQFVSEVKVSADTAHRLIPFIFGGGQDYMLLFGPSYIWFFQNGAIVMNGGSPLEVTTTYAAGDLPHLKYSQSGDQILLVVAGKPPRVLTRTGALTWTIADYAIGTTLGAPTDLFAADPQPPDAQHAGKAWSVVVTAYSTGDSPEESLPSATMNLGVIALYPDKSCTYGWTAPAGSIAGYFIYRGQPNDRFGYVGTSKTNSFRDDGQIPVYADPPPTGRTPFAGGSNFYPQATTFHALRLWFANSLAAPSSVWSSRIAALRSFDFAEPPRDDDAIIATLATRKYEEIRSMLSLGQFLYLFSSSTEWLLSGVQGAPPTPANSPAIPYSYWGSSWLDPIVIGEVPLFVTDEDNHVRELIVSDNPDTSRDLSFLASHLFKFHSLTDWAYARTPFSTVFQVRDDGVLLGLSYIRQLQQAAWCRSDTDGTFLNVGTLPGSGESDIYVICQRLVNGVQKKYVERFATRQIDHIREYVGLDSSVFYDGANSNSALTVTVTGLFGVGQACTITASTPIFAAGDVGDEIVLGPVEVGGDVRILITGFTNTTHVTGQVLVAVPAALQAVATPDWGFGRSEFTDLNHLQGVAISVLADGVPLPASGYTFVGVTVTLNVPAVYVVIGRAFTPDLGLLDVLDEKGKRKIVTACTFEVINTAKDGLQAGQTLATLEDFKALPEHTPGPNGFLADPTAPDAPAFVRIGIDSTWNQHGAAYLRQSKPLPATVLAVTRVIKVTNVEE